MKYPILTVLLLVNFTLLFGQNVEEERTGRKGQWLIETGTSLVTSVTSSSTGGGVLFSEGSTLTNIGINAGKFISNDFAIKFNLGVLSFGSGFGNSSQYTISGGGKYYIAGVAPVEIGAGVVTGDGTSLIGKATLGYAVALADNINFEPAGGVLIAEDSTAGVLQFSFVMFF